MYKLNSDTASLKRIVDKYCSKYDRGDANQYVVTDLYELLDDLADKINDLNDFSEIFRRILDLKAMQHKAQPNLSLDGGVGVG